MGLGLSALRVNTRNEMLKEELEVLRNARDVVIKSALMAGILVIPDELTIWNSEIEDEPSFEEYLFDALADQLKADDTAYATYLPFIIRGPVDLIREVRQLRSGDARLLEVLYDRINILEERLAISNEGNNA